MNITRIIAEIPLPSPDVTIQCPVGAKILGVRVQGNVPTVYALIDPHAPLAPRRFVVFGNGQVLSNGMDHATYIGSLGKNQGDAVHVFEAPLWAQLVVGLVMPELNGRP